MTAYTPMFRPMDEYMMKELVPGNDWRYIEACNLWDNSPLPKSKHFFGVFTTDIPLTEIQMKDLQVKLV